MKRMTTEQMISVQGGGYFEGLLCGAGILGLTAVAIGTGGAALGPTTLFFFRLGVAAACISALT